MNKRWRNVGLYVLAVITVIFIGTSVFDKPSTENATKTLRFGNFWAKHWFARLYEAMI